MSYTVSNTKQKTRSGGLSLGGKLNERAVFVVKSTTANENSTTICLVPGLPTVGLMYSGALCKALNAKHVDTTPAGVWIWEVTVTYGSIESVVDPETGNEQDPTDRPAVYSWGNRDVSIPAESCLVAASVDANGNNIWGVDADGNLVDSEVDVPTMNSAKDPYDPLPQKDAGYTTLTITRFESADTFDDTILDDYRYKVCIERFMGRDSYTARMTGITATSHYENGINCWRVSYTIEFNPDRWTVTIQDRGGRHIDASGKLIENMDDEGVKTGVILFLDGEGGLLARNADGTLAADPVYRRFSFYESVAFSPLNLEPSTDDDEE